MEINNVMMIIMAIVFIALFGMAFYNMYEERALFDAQGTACSKIGMVNYHAQDSVFCLDNENRAHYVRIDCKQISSFNYDCVPRIISIGDIRTSPT